MPLRDEDRLQINVFGSLWCDGLINEGGFTATAVFSTQFHCADCNLKKQAFGAAVVASGASYCGWQVPLQCEEKLERILATWTEKIEL